MSSGEWNTKLFPVQPNLRKTSHCKILLESQPDSNGSRYEMADIKEGWVDRGETLQLSSRQGKKIHLPFSVLSAISELCLFSNQILWPLLLFLDSDVLEFTS